MHTENFDLTLGIKIKASKVEAKVLMYLKKKTGKSISEIKKIIEENNYIFKCEASDDEGLHLINLMKNEIRDFGVDVVLFECGREVPSYMLDNLEQTFREIAEQCEMYPD